MTEFQRRNNDPISLRAQIGERVAERLRWLQEAADIVGGPNALIEDVFPKPPEVRQDAPEPNWTADQVEKVWDVARRFGYGAEQDTYSGLQGGVRIAEGGLAWKIMAESKAMPKDGDPKTLVFAGSAHRETREDENEFLVEKGLIDNPYQKLTEVDAAYLIADSIVYRQAPTAPVYLNFGYEIAEGNPTIKSPTGQLVHIGTTALGQSVQVLRVDRQDLGKDPETGKDKYRFQPDSMTLMRFMADVTMLQAKDKEPIGLATSNTYASRVVDAVRAGIKVEREFGVVMYGRETLRSLNAPVPAGMPINQLPGDLRSTYDKLVQLRTELVQ